MRIVEITRASLAENPRLIKEASALSRIADVTVICGEHFGWSRQMEQKIQVDLPSKVLKVPFGPFSPRMVRIGQVAPRILASTLLKTGLVWNQRMAEIAIHDTVRQAEQLATRIPADVYIAHYIAALPTAARAAARHGAKYAFDAEDFHLGDLPDAPEHALEKRMIRAIESRYLPGAAYMTAASPLIAEAYAETYGVPLPAVILNVFPKANAPAAPSPRGSAEPGPSLYWFSQTIGPGRGLETAVEAIARARSLPHLYLRGTPATGYEASLRSLAAHVGVAERLHFLDPAPPDQLERLGASYDLGYVGECDVSPNRLRALTNKLFSYLLGGVPSLATNIPAHRQLAPQLGEAMTLFPIGDAAKLAAAIDHLLLDPQRLASARAHAWELGQTCFNWDMEQQTLLRTVSGAMGFDRTEAKTWNEAAQQR